MNLLSLYQSGPLISCKVLQRLRDSPLITILLFKCPLAAGNVCVLYPALCLCGESFLLFPLLFGLLNFLEFLPFGLHMSIFLSCLLLCLDPFLLLPYGLLLQSLLVLQSNPLRIFTLTGTRGGGGRLLIASAIAASSNMPSDVDTRGANEAAQAAHASSLS